jgi:hypothetical protein
MESEEILQSLSEHTKLAVDIMKHVTTLSSGAVVLMATFMDKIKPLHFRTLIPWAIGFLLLGLVASMNGCFQISSNLAAAVVMRSVELFPEGTEDSNKAHRAMDRCSRREWHGVIAGRIGFGAFSVGMVLIGVYVIGNL